MALTDIQVKALQPREKVYRVTDSFGLCLEISPNGRKLWRFRYRFEGKANMLALGVYPQVSLKQARLARDEARLKLAQGINPSSRISARSAKRANQQTFKAIAEEWLDAKEPQWAASHSKRVRPWLERNIFPFIGDHSPDDIPPQELLKALKLMEARGAVESAHRVCGYCSLIFGYAIATGRASIDVAAACKRLLRAPKRGNLASITDPAGVGPLLRAIDSYTGNAITCLAMRLAPYVFLRPGELRNGEWAEINWDKRHWHIPPQRMKTGVEHIVPLSAQAVGILRDLHRITGHGQLLFPSLRTPGRPMSDMTLLNGLRNLGYSGEEMTVHGFRHMASTLLNEAGWNRDAIERQLSHSDKDSVRGTYNHAEYLPLRNQMMQAWADYLDALREWQPGTPLPVMSTCPFLS